MQLLERRCDVMERSEVACGGTPGANASALRDAGEALLRAGEDAIDRVIPADARAFLRAMRQEGGQ